MIRKPITMSPRELRALGTTRVVPHRPASVGPNALLGQAARKPRTRRDDPEHRIQCALVQWARTEGAALHPELEYLYSIPNGGKRGKLTAWKMQQEGALRGVCDLALDEARGGFFGAKLETKAAKGTLSRAQKDYMQRALASGYYVRSYRTFEEGRDLLLGYMAMPRTTVAR